MESTTSDSLNYKLTSVSQNMHKYSKRKMKFTQLKSTHIGIFAALSLIAGTYFSFNYSIELDKNRQKLQYISDLKQYTERIEKNAILIQNVDVQNFNELEKLRGSIDGLLYVLNKGGSIKPEDTKIDSLRGHSQNNLQKVYNDWSNNKPLIESLVSKKDSLTLLKKDIKSLKPALQDIISQVSVLQKQKDMQYVNSYLQEMILLLNRISFGFDILFMSENSSLEKSYALVKDLRTCDVILKAIKNGSYVYGIEKNYQNFTLEQLNRLEKQYQAFIILADKINPLIASINNAKDVALQITNSSKLIVLTAQEIDNNLNEEMVKLKFYRYLSFFLYLVSLCSISILAFGFYKKNVQFLKLAKVLQKNQNNEKAVNDLLQQMQPLDNGDFTYKINLEDKFLIKVSQKIDKTREMFRDIVRRLRNTSASIYLEADSTEKTSQQLLETSKIQIEKIQQYINKIGEITSGMDEVAQLTWIAKEESMKSQKASKEGEALVHQSMLKMDEIRNNIQESSKKIKKLGESAQAITEVVNLIQAITKQINILALNAAIQAASSGTAGREFTVVAKEVQRLAYDSEEATKKIENLVKNIQIDTAHAVSSMEKTTQEVVNGANLTDRAGQALKTIDEMSEYVAVQVDMASNKLEIKSTEMATVSLELSNLQKLNQQSADYIKQTAEQVEKLKMISNELKDYVKEYRVDD